MIHFLLPFLSPCLDRASSAVGEAQAVIIMETESQLVPEFFLWIILSLQSLHQL